jgi:hypothetical protein
MRENRTKLLHWAVNDFERDTGFVCLNFRKITKCRRASLKTKALCAEVDYVDWVKSKIEDGDMLVRATNKALKKKQGGA